MVVRGFSGAASDGAEEAGRGEESRNLWAWVSQLVNNLKNPLEKVIN